MSIATLPTRTDMKRQYALLWRLEKLLSEKQPQITKITLEVLHHLLSCEMLNREGLEHVQTMVTLTEK